MKATAIAPANVGLIKYWGRKDEMLRLPINGSISVNLSNLLTTTTVEFTNNLTKDEIMINGISDQTVAIRVIKHLDRIRNLAKTKKHAKVVSVNSFPANTGLSSSSSAFAALTLAGIKASGISLSEKDLSILARLASGSACRSIPDGFVEWLEGNTNNTSYAVSVYPPDYWDIADVVAVVSTESKEVSSTEGQKYVYTSPFFQTRLLKMKDKINRMKKILNDKNFTEFGNLLEAEALELHAIMLTSKPPLIYWTQGTLAIMKQVKKWRLMKLPVYFTINTGQDIHLFCKKENEKKLIAELKKISEVKDIIVNYPSEGVRLTDKHLF